MWPEVRGCRAWIVPPGLVGISKGDLSAFTVFVSVIKVFRVVWRRASLCDWGGGVAGNEGGEKPCCIEGNYCLI